MGYSPTDAAAASPLSTGGILAAPKGTALPTTAVATLNAAFKALGMVGEEGLTPSGEAATVTDLREWSGQTIASPTENKSITRFDFSLISIFDPDVAKFVFGTSNVTVTAADSTHGTKLAINEKGDELVAQSLVFDMSYSGKLMRVVVPNGKVTVTGELAFARTTLSGYTCSVTALPDTSGVRTYRYYVNDDLTA